MTAVALASLAPADEIALAQEATARFDAVGDAIPRPLAAEPGDARGRSVVVNRDMGACTWSRRARRNALGEHRTAARRVGARLSPGQLRLRVADSTRVNPATPMPAYYRTEGLDDRSPRRIAANRFSPRGRSKTLSLISRRSTSCSAGAANPGVGSAMAAPLLPGRGAGADGEPGGSATAGADRRSNRDQAGCTCASAARRQRQLNG